MLEEDAPMKNCSTTDGRMPDERQWFYFLYASLVTYFTGLLFALINYAVKSKYDHQTKSGVFLHFYGEVSICIHILTLRGYSWHLKFDK